MMCLEIAVLLAILIVIVWAGEHFRSKLLAYWEQKHEWVTLREWTVHAIVNGSAKPVEGSWRLQKCAITGKERLQSNFGSGWATEDED